MAGQMEDARAQKVPWGGGAQLNLTLNALGLVETVVGGTT